MLSIRLKSAIKTIVYLSGVFALLNAYAALNYVRQYITRSEFKFLFFFAVMVAAGLVFLGVIVLTYLGKPYKSTTNCNLYSYE